VYFSVDLALTFWCLSLISCIKHIGSLKVAVLPSTKKQYKATILSSHLLPGFCVLLFDN